MFERTHDVVRELIAASESDGRSFSIARGVGHLFEQSLYWQAKKDVGGRWQLCEDRSQRRRYGGYFTPQSIAALIVQQTLNILINKPAQADSAKSMPIAKSLCNLRICDSSVGAGHIQLRQQRQFHLFHQTDLLVSATVIINDILGIYFAEVIMVLKVVFHNKTLLPTTPGTCTPYGPATERA